MEMSLSELRRRTQKYVFVLIVIIILLAFMVAYLSWVVYVQNSALKTIGGMDLNSYCTENFKFVDRNNVAIQNCAKTISPPCWIFDNNMIKIYMSGT
jgi:hypothetical protein